MSRLLSGPECPGTSHDIVRGKTLLRIAANKLVIINDERLVELNSSGKRNEAGLAGAIGGLYGSG
ncbi:MAG: hypothetical protein ACR2PX_14555 [Endozoicomonas sp.]|uniref:hypothetical protein n=1 Tax=Endozoicomonas sp. TaxID=1892382 RepID=UPI003D9AEB6D